MGLQFIFGGARAGEPGVFASLQENPVQLERMIHGFGWNPDEPGAVVLCDSPNDIYVDQWFYRLLDTLESVHARRVVIDSLGDLAAACPDDKRFREFIYSLLNHCSRAGISAIVTFESPELYGHTTTVRARSVPPVRQRDPASVPAQGHHAVPGVDRPEDTSEQSSAADPRIRDHPRWHQHREAHQPSLTRHWDHGDPPTVYLSGEVDLNTHDQFAAVLDEAASPGRDLVLDCTKLTYIDVAGIRIMARAGRLIGDAQLRLKGVHGAVAVIIDVLDLASTVPNLRQDTQ